MAVQKTQVVANLPQAEGKQLEFYAKLRFKGESKFYFEAANGSVTASVVFAIHRPLGAFDEIAQLLDEYGAVEEMRVFQRSTDTKNPRHIYTYMFGA